MESTANTTKGVENAVKDANKQVGRVLLIGFLSLLIRCDAHLYYR